MKRFLRWFTTASGRSKLTFLGGAAAAITAAAWGAFTFAVGHFSDKRNIEMTFKVCRGDRRENCPTDATHITCRQDPQKFAAIQCKGLEAAWKDISLTRGGMCGYYVAEFKCSAK